MTQRIFILDDEAGMAKVAGGFLSKHGFEVKAELDPLVGLKRIEESLPDLLLLDIQMPKLDGFEVLRKLKANPKTNPIPIIMVSVQSDESNVVLGLGLGAEDYIVKPFREMELLARVKATLRRNQTEPPAKELKAGPLILNLSSYKAELEGASLTLNAKEFQLLALFLRRDGQMLTRGAISEAVWKNEHIPTSRTIDTHVKFLRKKLGVYGEWITTLKGIGYRFESEA